MATLTISDHLAQRLQNLAQHEGREIDALLDDLIRQRESLPPKPSNLKDALQRLAGIPGLTLPTLNAEPPPLTEEEDQALADLIGSTGRPLSEIVIEERQEGY